jgi:hypothetical protein
LPLAAHLRELWYQLALSKEVHNYPGSPSVHSSGVCQRITNMSHLAATTYRWHQQRLVSRCGAEQAEALRAKLTASWCPCKRDAQHNMTITQTRVSFQCIFTKSMPFSNPG